MPSISDEICFGHVVCRRHDDGSILFIWVRCVFKMVCSEINIHDENVSCSITLEPIHMETHHYDINS